MHLYLLRSSIRSITKTNVLISALLNAFARFHFCGAAFGLLVAVSVLMLGLGSAWAQTPAVSMAPVINTVAGTVGYGYNGDNIAATSAELWAPHGVAVDGTGKPLHRGRRQLPYTQGDAGRDHYHRGGQWKLRY